MDDPMIKEMDSAYETIVEKQKQNKTYYDTNTDNANKERKKAVSRVVQKYFPPGMKVEEAFKLLRLLKNQGFEIAEARHEGARKWPEGELKPYRSETSKRAYQPTGSMISYTATKRYERQLIIFEKHVYISIRTDGEEIVSSEGNIIPQMHVP